MSNYASGNEQYLANVAQFYGSIESDLERVAIERGFVTRNGTVSIEKLSRASDVSTATLWYILRDKKHFRAFNLVTMAKLCAALNVQPGDLIHFVPGGSTRGLGYSDTAFSNLIGTQNSGAAYDPSSDDGGNERGGEADSLSEVE